MKCFGVQAVLLGLLLGAVNPASGQAPGGDQGKGSNSLASEKAHDDSFIIGNDDVLAISVWKEPELTKAVPVRSDGKISLPLVGEIQAAGKSPLQLEQAISTKLQSFITTPEVTVIVQEVRSRKYNVLGEINKPGSYLLTATTTIMDAIALAGGFRDFAKKSGVYVLRKNADGSEAHLKFNYKDFIKGKNSDSNFKLEPNDTVIVP